MQELIQDLKTYLLENFGDKKDFLMLHSIVPLKPALKKETVILRPQIPVPPKKVVPDIKKEEIVEEETLPSEALSFTSEKPKVEAHVVDKEMNALYAKIAPKMKLIETPLNDDAAKQIRLASNKRSDLPEIPVLFDHSIQDHLEFLTSLAKAINTSFGKSSVVNIHEFEEKNLWKPLLAHSQIKLIIIPSTLLKHSVNLHMLTKEYPGRLLKSVEKLPLYALSEIQNSPLYKKEIWNTLTRFFTKVS